MTPHFFHRERAFLAGDRTEDMRYGLIRLIAIGDVRKIPLGEVKETDGTYVCAWSDCNEDAQGPIAGVLIGPS